jgi:hypothetical protein
MLGCGLSIPGASFAQGQTSYAGSNVTGQLILTRTVNLSQQAAAVHTSQLLGAQGAQAETPPKIPPKLWHPALKQRIAVQGATVADSTVASMTSIPINSTSSAFSFNGITQVQQRAAYNGNQFSIEPPSPNIAVANGYVLEGVNNGVQVYDLNGNPLLQTVVSSNQLFGLAPSIIWGPPKIYGPFPTDMRVFYDQGVNRWFVLQREQDNDTQGNALDSSHFYLAVSQTGDPTGTYNIYTMDTTDADNFFGCPCVADFPQVGSDQYGFYISANEFNTGYPYFVDATILAINKTALASGAATPTAVRFILPMSSGYEFAIQPSYTPPGASNFVASGGVEYFVSSQGAYSSDSNLAVWAMSNTSTLLAVPNLKLVEIFVPVSPYSYPQPANQRPGPLPYGQTLTPPGLLAYLDGDDSRILSATYSGGRVYVTFATAVVDETGLPLVGGEFVIFSPTFRAGILAAPVLRQGYLMVKGNHLLRPSIAVNSQGSGAIVFTLVGTNYFPSAAFLPINTFSTGSAIQVAAFGVAPEDGFSGYETPGSVGLARWGDYATAVAAADGSIWMGTEYIPYITTATPPPLANWGTLLLKYLP